MAARVLTVLSGCLVLVSVTWAQVAEDNPNRIRTRIGPPLTEFGQSFNILSVGAWWVRVNGDRTDTQSISWRFGKHISELAPAPHGPSHYLGWSARFPPGVSPELGARDRRLYPGNMTLWLWEYLKPEQIIYLRAAAKRSTDTASFCVFYQYQGVALVEFQGETREPVRIDRAEQDPRCVAGLDPPE